MARRQGRQTARSSQAESPFALDTSMGSADPFASRSSARLSPGANRPARKNKKTKKRRRVRTLTPGAIIGSLIRTLFTALFALLLFGAIGFALVAGAQILGLLRRDVVPPVVLTPAPEVALTSATDELPPQIDSASSASSGDAAAALPTPDLCPANEWWASHSAAHDRAVTAYATVALVPTALADAAAAALAGERDVLAAESAPDCLTSAQTALVRGYDEMVSALNTLNSDRAAATERARAAHEALANVELVLWDLNVPTTPQSPPALGIPRGGGAECVLDGWYNALVPLWSEFRELTRTTDVVNASPATVRANLDGARALVSNAQSQMPPPCAQEPHAAQVAAQSAFITAVDAALAGLPPEVPAADHARALYRFQVWLLWLGRPAL